MFKNAGEKIKITVKALFWVIAVFGTINGIYIVSQSDAYGLLMIPIAIVSAWVTSLVLYAFGDLCENIDLLRSNMYTVTTVMEKRFPDLAEEDPSDKADDDTDNKETNPIEE